MFLAVDKWLKKRSYTVQGLGPQEGWGHRPHPFQGATKSGAHMYPSSGPSIPSVTLGK